MKRRFSHPWFGLFLGLMVGLNAVTYGFAQPVAPAGESGLESYLQAGGLIADLCGTPTDGQKHGGTCPLCHLAHGPALPVMALAEVAIDLLARPAEIPLLLQSVARLPLDLGRGSRAPPAITA